jgi:hypothetical protein
MSKNVSNIIRLIKEEIDITDYANEDFIDVFVTIFKKWVRENHGNEIIKYPFSYLLNKYEDSFLKDLGLDRSKYRDVVSSRIAQVGKDLVLRSMFAYESVPKTDKSWFDVPVNKRIWDTMITRLDIPPYMIVNVNEIRPRDLRISADINFVDMIKSSVPLKYKYIEDLTEEIKDFLKKYGGVKFGNPAHGNLRIVDGHSDASGFNEWEKKELPNLKKELRTVAEPVVKSIKYEWTRRYGPTLLVTYNRRVNSGWTERYEALSKMKQLLADKGYSENLHVRD